MQRKNILAYTKNELEEVRLKAIQQMNKTGFKYDFAGNIIGTIKEHGSN